MVVDYRRIYDRYRLNFVYSVFKRSVSASSGRLGLGVPKYPKPKGLPYTFYLSAQNIFIEMFGSEYLIRYREPFNPLSFVHLRRAIHLLEERNPVYIESIGELWRLYRSVGSPDSDTLESISKRGRDWYIRQINSKGVLVATDRDVGYVGPYRYRTWDCYDFITALLFSVEYGIDKLLRVKEYGWKTTDTIHHYGYVWYHMSYGPEPWSQLDSSMILYAERCSPNNGRHDHWGIVIRFGDGLKVLHRTGEHWPRVDDLEFFYRFSSRERGPVHVYWIAPTSP